MPTAPGADDRIANARERLADTAARPDTLSTAARRLTRITSGLLLVLGLVLFLASEWASANLLWAVPPLATMTMGAWYLGGAFAAWEAARVWRWAAIFPAMVFLWAFTILEAAVLLAHVDRLRPSAAFGLPYLVLIALAAAASLAGFVDWVRRRPRRASDGRPVPPIVRAVIVLFSVETAIIVVASLINPGKEAGFALPDALSPFTLRAFGVFYLAIFLGVVSLVRERSLIPVLFFGRVGLVLVLTITAAAVAYLRLWDVTARPSQLIYWGTYVVLGLIAAAYVIRYARYSREAEPTA